MPTWPRSGSSSTPAPPTSSTSFASQRWTTSASHALVCHRQEAFRGDIQSKRRYFFGLRLCLLTTARGERVEVFLLPGSLGDGEAVERFPMTCPHLQPHGRKMVETAGSLISQLLPKSIHAVTSQGFELKVFLSVRAYSINCALYVTTWVT